MRIDRLKLFLDSMGGGAWPFLVGGVDRLVNSVNERDLGPVFLTSMRWLRPVVMLLRGTIVVQTVEDRGNNRSVMPFDVLGRTRATLVCSMCSTSHASEAAFLERDGESFKANRAGDRSLQLLVLNEEFLVSARHQRALISYLPFVHTARRYYRLKAQVSCREICLSGWVELHQT